MKSLLRQLYAGEIRPGEQFESLIEAHNMKRMCVMTCEEEFFKTLSDAQRIEFIRILDEYTGLISYEVESTYIQGMCLGAQLAVELLANDQPKKDRPNLT